MRVLIAVDGSDFSCEAIKRSCQMIGKKSDVSVKIISVYENPYYITTEPVAFSAEFINEILNFAKEQAERVVAEAVSIFKENLREENIHLTTQVIGGKPADEIIETAREWKADLIVMGSHGRGFWGRAIIGSVSDAVVHQAECPVMVIHKSETAEVKSTAGAN